MSSHWIDQKTTNVRGWRCQFWQSSDLRQQLIPEQGFLDQAMRTPAKNFKHDKTTSVVMLELDAHKIVLKRYNPRSWGHKIKRALRRSRARQCWSMSYAFANAGLNVSKPILMFEARFGPIRSNAYFANNYLQGEELLSSLPTMPIDQQQKVVDAIHKAFALMQQHKLSHGDMKASNLLWSEEKLYFIDLDAATKHRTIWSWRLAHRKDKKRFLKNWLDQPELLALFSKL